MSEKRITETEYRMFPGTKQMSGKIGRGGRQENQNSTIVDRTSGKERKNDSCRRISLERAKLRDNDASVRPPLLVSISSLSGLALRRLTHAQENWQTLLQGRILVDSLKYGTSVEQTQRR
ncbi:hypothetical protein RUM44_003967 [Polyplax serrata]|uniref:Uncharacterized protein n=1 Tax=Polyplax serrata TaxID=468196 RepID=A0ABR1B1I7_POLSC